VIILRKSHNKGFTRKDGVVVAPFDDKRVAKPNPAKAKQVALLSAPRDREEDDEHAYYGEYSKQGGLFGVNPKFGKPAKSYPKAIDHPALGDDGKKFKIFEPEKGTHADSWVDPEVVAIFAVGDTNQLPDELFGVQLIPWIDHPEGDDWDYVEGQMDDLFEPAINVPMGKKAASGVVIQEEDGRIWVVSPTNHFGGYKNVFPKGKAEEELSLQANAIKEAFEESGLKVEITGLIGDFERTTTVARMYSARRVGGSPAAVGWESQAVKLAPKSHLAGLLDSFADDEIIKEISQ